MMKPMNLFLPVLVALCVYTGKAQSCESCQDEKFMYKGCEPSTGRSYILCTSNPRGEANFKPWKMCMPASPDLYFLIDPYPQEINTLWYVDSDGDNFADDNEVIYSPISARQLIPQAFYRWTQICGGASNIDNTNCYDCPMKVTWERNIQRMLQYPTAYSLTTTRSQVPGSGCGSLDCNTLEIRVNVTDSRLGIGNTSEVPEVYYYTNRFGPVKTIDQTKEWVDFFTVITHEIGHWLGFEHYTTACAGSEYNDAMMTGRGIPAQEEWEISYQDKCMFMKLYCCPALTDVEEPRGEYQREYQQVGEVKVYPNPATNTISFTVPESYVGTRLHIYIQNLIGQVVYEGEVQADSRQ